MYILHFLLKQYNRIPNVLRGSIELALFVIVTIIFFHKLINESKDFNSAVSAATTYVAALAAIGATFAAFYTFQIFQTNNKQVEMSREQVRISQRQTDIVLDQRYDALKPIVFPINPIYRKNTLRSDNPLSITRTDDFIPEPEGDWHYFLTLENGGPGIAFNIQAVLFPSWNNEIIHCYNYRVSLQIVSGAKDNYELKIQGNIENKHTYRSSWLKRNDSIEGYPFSNSILIGEEQGGAKIPILARLILTYHDIFGNIHFAIYDYDYEKNWLEFKINTTSEDLGDIENRNRQKKE